MKKYNYFDDDCDLPEPSSSAKDKIKNFFGFLADKSLDLKDIMIEDGKAIGELKQYPNLRTLVKRCVIAAVVLIIVIVFVCVFAFSVSSSDRRNERFCSDAGKVCTDYIAEYGAVRSEKMDEKYGENLSRLTGTAFVRRLDFNADGKDELVVAYLQSGVYYFDIWGYDGKTLKKFYSDEANYSVNDASLGSWLVFYQDGSKYYFGKSKPEDPENVDLYTLKGKKFKKTKNCTYNAVTGIFSINGEANAADFERVQLSYVRSSKAELTVDLVTETLNEFNTKSTAEIEAQLTDQQLKDQAYYDIVEKLNKKYGGGEYKFEDGNAYGDGLAVVDFIDFDGDGNDEMLTVFRREVKKQQENAWTGETVLINVPTYSIRVYNWNGTIAKCIFSRDNISQMYGDEEGVTQFYILKKSGKRTDLCFNSYSYESQSVYTAYSRIFRMKDEAFSSIYDAKLEYRYGYETYYLDGEQVYSATFNTKGYEVPYFMNDDSYDTSVYTVVYLAGGKTKSDYIKDAISKTQINIKKMNDEYVLPTDEEEE